MSRSYPIGSREKMSNGSDGSEGSFERRVILWGVLVAGGALAIGLATSAGRVDLGIAVLVITFVFGLTFYSRLS